MDGHLQLNQVVGKSIAGEERGERRSRHGRSRPRLKREKVTDYAEKKVKFRLFLISFAFNLI